MVRSRTLVTTGLFVVFCIGLVGVAAIGGAKRRSGDESGPHAPDSDTELNVSEDAYVEAAPGPNDEYYYEASDGNWVSYVNPRDEYREPYLGEGSAKMCVTLLNEAGDPIVGETVPNTTVTLPTSESTSWHSHADQ